MFHALSKDKVKVVLRGYGLSLVDRAGCQWEGVLADPLTGAGS